MGFYSKKTDANDIKQLFEDSDNFSRLIKPGYSDFVPCLLTKISPFYFIQLE